MLLSGFDDKKVRVTLTDGEVFEGIADSFPAGYDFWEEGKEEEGIQIGDTIIFRSQIRRIEELGKEAAAVQTMDRFLPLIEELLEGPWWVVDILPRRVPKESPAQYFAVEQYYLQPNRIREIYRRYAEILIRLNCYYGMAVSLDDCETWEKDPDPESFVHRVENAPRNRLLRAVFEEQRAMIDLDFGYTDLAVYDPEGNILDILRSLATAEGFFLWLGEET